MMQRWQVQKIGLVVVAMCTQNLQKMQGFTNIGGPIWGASILHPRAYHTSILGTTKLASHPLVAVRSFNLICHTLLG